MLIFRLMLLFWDTTRFYWHALMFKKCIVLTVYWCSTFIHLLRFNACLFKVPHPKKVCSDWSFPTGLSRRQTCCFSLSSSCGFRNHGRAGLVTVQLSLNSRAEVSTARWKAQFLNMCCGMGVLIALQYLHITQTWDKIKKKITNLTL